MSSLANCLKIHNISPAEAKLIRQKAKDYKREKFSAKEANEGAVQDVINQFIQERENIIRQIEAAKKGGKENAKVQETQKTVTEVTPFTRGYIVKDRLSGRIGVVVRPTYPGRVEVIFNDGRRDEFGQVQLIKTEEFAVSDQAIDLQKFVLSKEPGQLPHEKLKSLKAGDTFSHGLHTYKITDIYEDGSVKALDITNKKKPIERVFHDFEKETHLKLDTSEAKKPEEYGTKNTVFTKERADAARERLRKKLNRVYMGLDPEIVRDGIEIAGFHIEAGARKFKDYSLKMIEDFGEAIRPYLRSFYMAVRNYPSFDNEGMNTEAELDLIEKQAEKGEETKPYFIYQKETRNFMEVDGKKITFEGFETNDLFIYHHPKDTIDNWAIYEGHSGIKVSGGRTRKEAIENTRKLLEKNKDRIEEAINRAIESTGRSPRYAGVDFGEQSAKIKPEGVIDESLGTAGNQPLEGVSAEEVRGTSEGGPTTAGGGERGRADREGTGRTDVAGSDVLGGVGAGERVIPIPEGRAELGDVRETGRPERTQDNKLGNAEPSGSTERSGLTPTPGEITPKQNYTITDADNLGKGSQAQKFADNVAAIKLIKKLQEEGRQATPEEQAVLVRYVGWGGIKTAFPDETGKFNKGWEKKGQLLKDLLSKEEWDAAYSTILDAHYTSQAVINSMYEIVDRLGFKGGNVLEPSMGTGNFFGLMPLSMRNDSALTGVEFDNITGAIAKQLYPNTHIMAPMGFEDARFADNFFDLTIGNPPFGNRPIPYGTSKHLKGFTIHNYFFAKSLDKLRPGGIQAMVVSRWFLDKKDASQREYLAHRANFIGAIRLPNTAFQENALTEVTTDIVIFQKLPEEAYGSADKSWTKTGMVQDPLGGEDIEISQYFIDNPVMMLGRMERSGKMVTGMEPTLAYIDGSDINAMMQDAINQLPQNIYGETGTVLPTYELTRESVEPAPEGYNIGSYIVEDGKLKHIEESPDGSQVSVELTPETQWTEKQKLGQGRYERLMKLAELRDSVRKLLRHEVQDDAKSVMEEEREKLNKLYDEFVKEHGYLNNTANASLFHDDPDSPLLLALENNYERGISKTVAAKLGIKPEKPTASKATIFKKRVISPYVPVNSADTAEDALMITLSQLGEVNITHMANLTGKENSEIIKELHDDLENPIIFLNPETDTWEQASKYLSGNVKKKEKIAREKGLIKNAEALRAVFPPDIKASDLSVKLGASWVNEKTYEDFAKYLFGDEADVVAKYIATDGRIIIDIRGGNEGKLRKYSTPRIDGPTLLKKILGSANIAVYDVLDDGSRQINKDATVAAIAKADEIRQEFEDWIFSEAGRRDSLLQFYNDNFNTDVEPKYDGEHLLLPGKVPDATIQLRRHQKNAIWRIIQDQKALLDHVVGAGKTYTMVAASMEMKRMGIVRKPMIVVPNHLVTQWAKDFYTLYPGAKILAMKKKDFEKRNRRTMLSRIATGDWDSVIVAHSSFGFINVDKEWEASFIKKQIDDLMEAARITRETEGKRSRRASEYQKAVERLQAKLKALLDKPIDNILTFEELGVDHLFVDESHEFKNLFFTTAKRMLGLGNPMGSQKAMNLYMKAQWLQQKHSGKGVVFATGTPVSNSLSELYTIQRYLGLQDLENRNIKSFDAWLNNFGLEQSDYELDSTGVKLKAVNRLRSLTNIPEIMSLYKQYADGVTNDDIKKAYKEQTGKEFPIPGIKGGQRQNVVVDRSDDQAAYFADIVQRADAVEKKDVEPEEDNMLKITTDARKAALDIRLVDPGASDHPGSKTHVAADRIRDIWEKWSADKGTQLVFLDLSIPLSASKREQASIIDLINKADAGDEEAQLALDKLNPDDLVAAESAKSGFSVYDDLRSKLIDRGIPAGEIAFIHDYNTDNKKQDLYDMVNAGKIRVLLGSTSKLGAGTNVQKKLVAEHHLDCPWRPSDIEQREGRIIRQGNELVEKYGVGKFDVEIHAYATEQTYDARMWQVQEQKLIAIGALRSYKGEREIEEVAAAAATAAEMKAASTGNPLILEEVKLKDSIRKLEIKQKSHKRQIWDAESDIKKFERALEVFPEEVKDLEVDAEKVRKYKDNPYGEDRPSVKIQGKEYTDRQEALKAANDEKLRQIGGKDVETLVRETLVLNIDGEDYKGFDTIKQYIVDHISEGFNVLVDGKKKHVSTKDRAESIVSDAMDVREKEVMKSLPKFSIDINGTPATSSTAITKAIHDAFGDMDPFAMEIGGKAYIKRSDAGKAAQDMIDDQLPTVKGDMLSNYRVGTFAGMEVFIDALNHPKESHGRMYEFEVSIKLRGKSTQIDSGIVSNTPGMEISRVERLAKHIIWELSTKKATLKSAKEQMPVLQQILSKTWPQQQELDEKKARLAEVQKILSEKPKKQEEEGGEAPALSLSEDEDLKAFAQSIEAKNAFGSAMNPETSDDYLALLKKDYMTLSDREKFIVDNLMSPEYSLGDRKAAGLDMGEVKASIVDLQKEWKNGPDIRVVQSQAQLPDRLQKYISSSKGKGAVEGIFDPNTKGIYLVADNLRSIGRAHVVLFHEAVGHYGLRGILGGDIAPILNQAYIAKKKEADQIAKKYGLDVSTQEGKQRAAEEVLARMAEKNEKSPFLQKVYAAIRNWLRKIGFNINLSDNDLRVMVSQARQFIEEGKKPLNLSGLAAMSRREARGGFYSQLYKVLDNKLPDQVTPTLFNKVIGQHREGILGIKPEEIADTKATVSAIFGDKKILPKQEILDYLRASDRTDVQDVVLGGDSKYKKLLDKFSRKVSKRLGRQGWTFEDLTEEEYKEYYEIYKRKDVSYYTTLIAETKAEKDKVLEDFKEAENVFDRISENLKKGIPVGSSNKKFYDDYFKNGNPFEAELYRLYDKIKMLEEEKERSAIQGTHFSEYSIPGYITDSYREQFVTAKKISGEKLKDNPEQNWKDGHSAYSNIENPIVRIRYNDRTDADGNIIRFIEELQGPNPENEKKMPEIYRKYKYQIGLKRILQNIAEENETRKANFEDTIDAIAWTTGDTQAYRYNLSTYIDEIGYAVNDDGTYEIHSYKHGEELSQLTQKNVPSEKLENIVGLNLAKRIRAGEGAKDGDLKMFGGLDLKVGGEGLKRVYDVTIPKFLNKYGEQWGVKVKEVEITLAGMKDAGDRVFDTKAAAIDWADENLGNHQYEIQKRENIGGFIIYDSYDHKYIQGDSVILASSIPITPEMQADILQEGQPLFARQEMSVAELETWKKQTEELYAAEPLTETDAVGRLNRRLTLRELDNAIKKAREREKTAPMFSRGDIDPVSSDFAEVEQRIQASKGAPKAGLKEKITKGIERTAHSFTRHFPLLDPKRDGAESDILRRAESIPEYAKKTATKDIAAIVGNLRKNQAEVFTRVLILDDMLKDIESGLLKGELPFGYGNEEQVRADLEKFQRAADGNAEIRAALEKRKQYMDNLRNRLVGRGLLHESVNEDDRYFHHQVLEYMAIRAEGGQYTGLSSGDMRLKKKGWQLARKGSYLDYNTDYLQSEFEVVSQALSQIETADTMKRLKRTADISGQVRAEARDHDLDNWQEAIPEGYTIWQPEKGNHFYRVHVLTERVLDQLLADIDTWDTTKSFDELMESNEVRQVLALGGKKEQWVIPDRLAKTLDNFRAFKDEGPVGKASKSILNTWKQWTLLNPFRIVKYNLNNMSGDLDIALAYSPKILKYAKGAMADLLRDQRNKAVTPELQKELDIALKKGVITSGITIHEITDINESGLFSILTGKDHNLIQKIWKTAKDYTNWRENILRLAAYRHFKNEIDNGKKVYGASKKAEIDKITNPDDRAAKLARELIGDYGNVSEAGQWIRAHMIPFWSWAEINAPRYVRLMRNLKNEGRTTRDAQGIIAWKATKLGLKASILFALISLWNGTFWPDEEEELGIGGRRQLHIILGRNEDGTIRTLRFQGALSDALSWFGLENLPQDVKDVTSGRTTFSKKFEEAYKAPINKVIQGMRPLEKVGYEVATGKTLYPDVLKPRPIRDKAEHIFKSLSLDMPYRAATGKPSRGDEVAGFISYRVDPGEAAYYDTLSDIRDFLKEHDVDVPDISPTKRSNALYYYKQAKKYGDQEAKEKYLKEYLDAGGRRQDILKSIKKSDPLSFVPIKLRVEYMKSLNGEDLNTLNRAREWWRSTYFNQ